ncbi:LVIS_2131 family protein [Agrilactobacillus yilanensis]|uniref:LVIS_2131 family protein n=1 Tax=Agrilactobacillus yilanensis TaxID=2485997 RepID=A0ABW4J4D4_9LACO|nr:LVIS_2131 family protein [Agrilactobacillus yilanensis]
MSSWNIIGIVAWVIVLVWVIFIVMNIRKRHLKMIIKDHKRFTWQNLILDIVEVAVFVVITLGMTYVTFFRLPDLKDNNEVKITYNYKPLVLQTNGVQGYFVKVQNGNGKRPIQYYTYWTQGARYEISSKHAGIVTASDPLATPGGSLPWPKAKVKKVDQEMQHAFVAHLSAKYQPNFLNGLGLRVGHHAYSYFLIRVPSDTFVDTTND